MRESAITVHAPIEIILVGFLAVIAGLIMLRIAKDKPESFFAGVVLGAGAILALLGIVALIT